MMKKLLLSMLIAVGILSCSQTFAGLATIDASFNTRTPVGLWTPVYGNALAIQSDGKIIIWGSFAAYRWVVYPSLVRIFADGTLDATFTGWSYRQWTTINSIAIQSNGKIIVAWAFSTTINWFSANRIVRLNSDGTVDTSFAIGNGFNDEVKSVLVQNDGKIVAIGLFTTYKGSPVSKIVRLNTDGSLDTWFVVGTFAGWMSTSLATFAIQSDGRIVVAGDFATYSWVAARDIVRLNTDGKLDTWFAYGSGFYYWYNGSDLYEYANFGQVNTIKLQSNGKIIVWGWFNRYNGNIASNLVRLNSDGTFDSSFNNGNTYSFNSVYSVFVQPDDKILFWTQENGTPEFLRLNSDWTTDNTYPAERSDTLSIKDIKFQSDGKPIIVWWFTAYQWIGANGIVRLTTNWYIDTSLAMWNGFDSFVKASVIQSDGKIILWGSFASYASTGVNKIVRLTTGGTIDSSFSIWSGFDSDINTLSIQSNGKIIVGWDFTKYKWTAAKWIIRLNTDWSIDGTFTSGIGFSYAWNNVVNTITLQSDGKILVWWNFTSYQWSTGNKIIRLNTDWSVDGTFSVWAWFNGTVNTIYIQSDGKIVVWGWFSSYKWVAANRIIRLNTDGSRDAGFTVWAWFNGDGIKSVLVLSNWKIVAWWVVSSYQWHAVTNIALINSDGSIDSTFLSSVSSYNWAAWIYWISTMTTTNSWNILVGGKFGAGTNFIWLGRLNSDGSVDTNFSAGNGFDSVVTLSVASNGRIIVWWLFDSYDGTPAGNLTALYGETSLVKLPNSSNPVVVNAAFTTQGYTDTGWSLVGSTPISMSWTDGNIPVSLNLTNDNIWLSITPSTQLKGQNGTNYSGIISTPVLTPITSISDLDVLSAFKVGNLSENISLSSWYATFTAPVNASIWDIMIIYYSADNGVTWYPDTVGSVVNNSGTNVVVFTTNHLAMFAIVRWSTVGRIDYSLLTPTLHNIICSVYLNQWSITNNGGGNVYTFTGNGSFFFDYSDGNGLSWKLFAKVSWIDKEAPIINGILTGWIYTWSVTFTAMDTGGISGVMLDNTALTWWTNYTISLVWVHNLLVTDIAGNSWAVTFEIKAWPIPAPGSNGWWGWGGGSVSVDITPTSQTWNTQTLATKKSPSILGSRYSKEFNDAYIWTYGFNITTIASIQEANLEGPVYRAHLAKMISQYAINVLKKIPNTGMHCEFSDMKLFSSELQTAAIRACQLWLMGLKPNGTPDTKFSPSAEVTRAQFGTTLSRLLYGSGNNSIAPNTQRYEKHLQALKTAGIMNKITSPFMDEIRGNVFLMLMRSASK